MISWLQEAESPHAASELRRIIAWTLHDWQPTQARSVLVLTNTTLDSAAPEDVGTHWLGSAELSRIVAGAPELRLQVPSLLGIAEISEQIPREAMERSTGDVGAADDLARVFVATGPYVQALDALERHNFTVLTGPPEMGKTAIARTIGLALLSNGWEFHECINPEELWRLYARDRRQLFVADDAFGSTEYRPEAAERWALELDRVLRTMDGSHRLVWTSRPAPLKAALRRLHREHGVERFPAPAEVQVDAADLEVVEKALILFRHAKAAALPRKTVHLVQGQGPAIVGHEHFTPERIRRFVGGRLLDLDPDSTDDVVLGQAVSDELRQPTAAMAASFRALAPEHRTVLIALLDTPPGPVPERALVAAVRRHSQTTFARAPTELVDRLTDHFLRPVKPASMTWIHPSWRDLVIEELALDRSARRTFVLDSSLDGVLLALSSAGGDTGERVVPLLLEDADWDALTHRIGSLGAELDGPEITRLLATLAETRIAAPEQRDELDALAAFALARIARRWDETHTVIEVGLLSLWFELAGQLPEPPVPPDLATSWIELLPTADLDLADDTELVRFDEWTALAELLNEHAHEALASFGFPAQQSEAIGAFVRSVWADADAIWHSPRRALVAQILDRLGRISPEPYVGATRLGHMLRRPPPSPFDVETPEFKPISRELALDAPLATPRTDEAIVFRVLRDL